MSETFDPTPADLRETFSGEAFAHMRYLIFSEQAAAEGKPEAAALFRSLAAAEAVHAHRYWRYMPQFDTNAAIDSALDAENRENTVLYPHRAEHATAAHHDKEAHNWREIAEVEGVHVQRLKMVKEALQSGQPTNLVFYVCPVCGNIHAVANMETGYVCEICHTEGSKFFVPAA